ncbi:MAG TPA: hypothetical protein VN175_06885 [Rhizomicrobium sp.]|nr:hypothetical protein [Rhizomicrobium sp.]
MAALGGAGQAQDNAFLEDQRTLVADQKWGEALVYAGRHDEANAQFARAAQLDLTPTEKAELAKYP